MNIKYNNPCITQKDVFDVFLVNKIENMHEEAIFYEDKILTYHEFEKKTNSLAAILRDMGVGRDTIVGIISDRSFEMLIGIYAIVKAGGAYLPIAPSTPMKRLKFIIEDSALKIVLVQKKVDHLENSNIEILYLSDDDLYQRPADSITCINQPEDLIYVIYTSGTTGNPKGVMIEHRSLVNRLNWMQTEYPIDISDTILFKTTFCFDVSVWEIFWWVITGAKIALLESNYERYPLAIVEAIRKYKITIMHFVPSMLNIFLNYLSDNLECINHVESLKKIFVSGEKLTVNQVNKFQKTLYLKNKTRLINLYGPTEATIDVTYYECPLDNDEITIIPIGKPITNTTIKIVKDNAIQIDDEPGELLIEGIGLARGYMNRPKLTNSMFIKNSNLGNQRMYRSGDNARILPDGNIEYLGRIDNQVKINGLRIELEEIETVICRNTPIKQCVVIDSLTKDMMPIIVAFYNSDTKIEQFEIRDSLNKYLPAYMIPNKFIRIEQIPLSENGKIDRKQLRQMAV